MSSSKKFIFRPTIIGGAANSKKGFGYGKNDTNRFISGIFYI